MIAFGSVCAQNTNKSCQNYHKLHFINGNCFLNKIKSKTVEEQFCGIYCVYQADCH